MNPGTQRVLGIPVSDGPLGPVATWLDAAPGERARLVTFVNPGACHLSRHAPDYVSCLEAFDLVLCDGLGMVMAAHKAGLPAVERASFDFTSLAGPVLEWAVQRRARTGLVGGEPGVAEAAAEILGTRFPGLEFTRSFSGFGPDPEEAAKFHVGLGTELVIAGMGAPRQEEFLLSLKAGGWQGRGFTCGGFFDQLSAGGAYYPAWVDRMNLRFLYRLGKEPGRLWKRYLLNYQVFAWRYLTTRSQKAGTSGHE